MGDFNEHPPCWDKENRRKQSGNTIYRFLENTPEYFLITPRGQVSEVTRISQNMDGYKDSTLDLVIGSQLNHSIKVTAN